MDGEKVSTARRVHEVTQATGEAGEGVSPPEATEPTGTVLVRYWAAAKVAAGVASEEHPCGLVGEVLERACASHEALRPVVGVSTVLLDGQAVPPDRSAPAGATLEVLPPFAGG